MPVQRTPTDPIFRVQTLEDDTYQIIFKNYMTVEATKKHLEDLLALFSTSEEAFYLFYHINGRYPYEKYKDEIIQEIKNELGIREYRTPRLPL